MVDHEMGKITKINLESVSVTFPAGTHISKALREAVSFSALEYCEVQWEHNEQTVVVDARPLIEKVYAKFSKDRF